MNEKNKNLSAEQKLILFEEGTERPGSSELNFEKREGSYPIVLIVTLNYSTQKLNMKVVPAGLHFMNLCQRYLRQKQITS